MASKPKISLAWQMMIGLALGVVVGAFVDSAFAQTYLQPLGQLSIRLIRTGGRRDDSGRAVLPTPLNAAGKVLLVYAITTASSVLFSDFRGRAFDGLAGGQGGGLSPTTLLEIVPMEAMLKHMLQIIFFAVIFGFCVG